jgi:hypothetical protein
VPKVCASTDPSVSGFLDLASVRNLRVHSHGLGNVSATSVAGDRDIIKQVPATEGYGGIIFDQAVVGADYWDCSKQTLSRLSFKLTDIQGNMIDLTGRHWSFALATVGLSSTAVDVGAGVGSFPSSDARGSSGAYSFGGAMPPKEKPVAPTQKDSEDTPTEHPGTVSGVAGFCAPLQNSRGG